MTSNFHFDDLFHEKTDYVAYSFNVYRKIYDLPEIEYVGEVSPRLFDYVRKRKFFLLLAIYDEQGRIYLERNVQEQLYWSLPGGSIRKGEDFHSAINRLAKRLNEPDGVNIVLGEIEPIAFVKNRFRHAGEEFEHLGIAFAARLRNGPVNPDDSLGRFVFINEKELDSINRYANREVAKLCHRRVSEFRTDFPEFEIATNERHHFRYLVHDRFVKRFILTPHLKRKEAFRRLIIEKLGQSKSLLDISCGDSDLIFRLGESGNFDYLVGNDVSWSQIKTGHRTGQKIIFTNHNAACLPFKTDAFDALYCGNTLHHMNSREELKLLLTNCLRVAGKVIFVEIEKPGDTGWFPNLLHKYWYGWFLGDAGGAYLSKRAFQSIINEHFHDQATVTLDEFRNIQGRYLIAEVNKKQPSADYREHVEMEEKFYLDDAVDFEARLAANGFSQTEDAYETDDYFTDPAGQFVRNRTCLRLRSKGQRCELTFKGKSGALSNYYAKVEHNLEVDGESLSAYKGLLNSLGYHKYVSVIKHRQVFSRRYDGLTYNAAIDSLENIGSFVEFEILAPVANWHGREPELRQRLNSWLREFGADRWVKADLPYRDFVAKGIKEKILGADSLRALLIDFDGTIIPSEILFFRAYRDATAAQLNYEPMLEEYKEFELGESDGLFGYLKTKTGVGDDRKEKLMAEVYRNYEHNLDSLLTDDRVLANLDALRTLRELGLKLALVTTSKRQYVNKILGHFGRADLFDAVVCREDVAAIKPSGLAFTAALDRLGLQPNDCLAIEDSRRGVAAARAAGLRCLGVYGLSLTTKDELAAMSLPVFEDIKEIIYVLKYA